MARFQFPGKPAKCNVRPGGRSQRILATRLPFSRDKMLVADNTGRWLELFHALLPAAEEVGEGGGGA